MQAHLYPQWLSKGVLHQLAMNLLMILHFTKVLWVVCNTSLTRPDIVFLINFVCQFMHEPTMGHYQAVRCILHYIIGILQYGMNINSQSTLDLYPFSDADWAGCPLTRRSTTGCCTFLGANCLSWCAKKQPTELTWLTYLLRHVGLMLTKPPILHCDNLSALHMIVNPVFHGRPKHIELDYHFVRERVAMGNLVTHFVLSRAQLADIFTKHLPRFGFMDIRNKLRLSLKPRHS